MRVDAFFSPCRQYRYTLHRIWSEKKPFVMFVGLNPSTADERKNDPTVTRCIRFAGDWGYGGMVMMNIFAYRSTNPNNLYKLEDPVGEENNLYIAQIAREAGIIVTAWGNHGAYKGRGDEVLRMLTEIVPAKVHHLGLTGEGQPKHPLYLRADEEPRLWAEVEKIASAV